VVEIARLSDEAGCRGILVYTDNSQMDPWLVAQAIIQNTRALCPLVAVQPLYMHPYTVAKMVTTLGNLYGRRLYLNMVAGGFSNDAVALDDTTPHDRRYDRLVEYTSLVKRLLAGGPPVTVAGEFYRVQGLRLAPPLPPALAPGLLVSGSSAAGWAAAKAIEAVAVRYPGPERGEAVPAQGAAPPPGIRVGIIARESEEEAWQVAHARFPLDRKGELAHQLAMKVSDSHWHKQLSGASGSDGRSPYWLVPFQTFKTFCPYLVGSYERVAEEIASHLESGHRTFILDVPPGREELEHINVAFERAVEAAACPR